MSIWIKEYLLDTLSQMSSREAEIICPFVEGNVACNCFAKTFLVTENKLDEDSARRVRAARLIELMDDNDALIFFLRDPVISRNDRKRHKLLIKSVGFCQKMNIFEKAVEKARLKRNQ